MLKILQKKWGMRSDYMPVKTTDDIKKDTTMATPINAETQTNTTTTTTTTTIATIRPKCTVCGVCGEIYQTCRGEGNCFNRDNVRKVYAAKISQITQEKSRWQAKVDDFVGQCKKQIWKDAQNGFTRSEIIIPHVESSERHLMKIMVNDAIKADEKLKNFRFLLTDLTYPKVVFYWDQE
jgi:hypothetical protein